MGNACGEGIFKPKGDIRLQYFPISGRAEPIRLALHLGKHEFYDQRISGPDWEDTWKKLAPYGQMPVLIIEQKKIAQTKAILRFVGKMVKHDGKLLYPKDPLLAAKVDEIIDAFDDLWILLAPTYRITDPEQKAQARKDLFAEGGQATVFVKIFEEILSKSCTGFVVSEAGFTIADLTYFCFLNSIRSGFIDGLKPELFDDYTHIRKHREMVANMPAIKEYYEKPDKSNPMKVPYYEVFLPEKN